MKGETPRAGKPFGVSFSNLRNQVMNVTNYSDVIRAMQRLRPWQFVALWAWMMARSLTPWAVVAIMAHRYLP